MPASQADTGFGTKLLKGDGATPTEAFTDFGIEITSITPPGLSRDSIDVTHMQSPDEFREFIEGLMNAGEFSCDLNWKPSATDTIVAELISGKANWQMQFPNGVTWTMSAFVTNYPITVPMDNKMTASVTWKVSGKPTLDTSGS